MGCSRQGSRGLSTHLDGRQGRRLGRDAAARQGGRDQCALVQRPAPARKAGFARSRGRRGRAPLRRACRDALRESFNRRFWYADGGYLYDVRRWRTTATNDPACRPNQIFAISLDHPVLDRDAVGRGAGRGAGQACSRRSGCARWRPVIPTTSRTYYGDLRSRDARLPPGHGLGVADRAVRRRLAEGPSRTTAPGRELLDGLPRHI